MSKVSYMSNRLSSIGSSLCCTELESPISEPSPDLQTRDGRDENQTEHSEIQNGRISNLTECEASLHSHILHFLWLECVPNTKVVL